MTLEALEKLKAEAEAMLQEMSKEIMAIQQRAEGIKSMYARMVAKHEESKKAAEPQKETADAGQDHKPSEQAQGQE